MIGLILSVVKWLALAALAVWGVLALLDWIGPTEPVVTTPRFDATSLGDDLDDWLAATEADVPDLQPFAEKRIVWAGAPGARTGIALVYLHGFSATAEEVRPLPETVAGATGANLYFARLAGHGRDGAAMAEPTVQDYVDDLAEAMAIGRRLGDRVVLIGNSTGSTLAALAASDPALNPDLAGVVLMSPNFRVAGFAGRVIEWPFARIWGPLVVGAERSFEPRNEDHGRFWTTSYPTTALATLGALVHHVRGLDLGAIGVPALFLVSTEDQVIDARSARRAAARWGAPSELVPVVMTARDDPSGHVLAGDVLSPEKTAPIAARISEWIRQL